MPVKKHNFCQNCNRCTDCGECETEDCHPAACKCRECLLVRPYDDLDSVHCAACGKRKQRRQSFCRTCFYSLTPQLRSKLYNPAGYAETYTEAKDLLLESKGDGVEAHA